MDFITAEKFSQSDKKVQDKIIKWCKPEYGDLFSWCRPTHDIKDGSPITQYTMQVFDVDVLSAYETDNFEDTVYRHQHNDYYVPLLTVGQLINFIKHEGISIQITLDKDKEPIVDAMLPNNETKKYDIKRYSHTELIYALWELVCEICVLENVDK